MQSAITPSQVTYAGTSEIKQRYSASLTYVIFGLYALTMINTSALTIHKYCQRGSSAVDFHQQLTLFNQ